MPRTVVIIDDDADDLEIMKEALAYIDPSVLCLTFGYADEAIRILGGELIVLPDYVFIDFNIPRITGRDCMRQIRSLPDLREVPIIMYSTSMPQSMAATLVDEGATFAFQKPFGFDDYVSILKGIFYPEG